MSYSSLSDLFEYLCYGSTAIRNMFTLTARMDFSRQNLTSTDVRFWRLKSIPALCGLNINYYYYYYLFNLQAGDSIPTYQIRLHIKNLQM